MKLKEITENLRQLSDQDLSDLLDAVESEQTDRYEAKHGKPRRHQGLVITEFIPNSKVIAGTGSSGGSGI